MNDKKQIPIHDYHMSVHNGLCLGPIDELCEIRIKDRIAWPHSRVGKESDDLSIASRYPEWDSETGTFQLDDDPASKILSINQPNLFGGDEGGGGCVGIAEFLPGGRSQLLSSSAASRFGLTPETMPGFRGVATLMFYGGQTDGDVDYKRGTVQERPPVFGQRGLGFQWGSNDPYLPAVSVLALRHPRAEGMFDENPFLAASDETQFIAINRGWATSNLTDDAYIGANPAALIYEVLTSGLLEIRMPVSAIDTMSFQRAARVLSRENFGLSFLWVEGGARKFLSTVMDHIGGAFVLDPSTGKLGIRLLRSDPELRLYNRNGYPDTRPGYARADTDLFRGDIIINPDNAVLREIRRKAWGDLVTTLNISYTNRNTGEPSVVTVHSDHAISVQGGQTSQNRDLSGIIDDQLALDVGLRELHTISWPSMSADIEMGREAMSIRKYDVLPMIWPGEGIETLVRVMEIDYGKPGASNVRLTVTEDLLGQKKRKAIAEVNRVRWTDDSKVTHMWQGYTAATPYSVLARMGLGNTLQDMVDTGDNFRMHLIDTQQISDRCQIHHLDGLISRDTYLAIEGTLEPAGSISTTPIARSPWALPAEAFSSVNLEDLSWTSSVRPIQEGDMLVVVRSGLHDLTRAVPDEDRRDSSWDSYFSYPIYQTTGLAPSTSLSGHGNRLAAAAADLFEGNRWAEVARQISEENRAGGGMEGIYPEEWISVDAYNLQTGEATLRRGIFDTTPAPIRPGDRIFHFPVGHQAMTPRRDDGSNLCVAFQPKTIGSVAGHIWGYGQQKLDSRIQRPTRPANVRLSVQAEGQIINAEFGKVVLRAPPEAVTISYSVRDKRTEDATVPAWNNGGVAGAPETKVRIWRRRRIFSGPASSNVPVISLVTTIAAPIGPDVVVELPAAAFLGPPLGDGEADHDDRHSFIVEVIAEDDGYESRQNAIIGVEYRTNMAGYGVDYGMKYGAA